MKTQDQERIIVTHLIDICKDGRDFYHNASEKVENNDLKKLFRENANIREGIIVNLKNYMEDKGETAKAEGTLGGKTMQFFGQLAAAVSPNTDKAFVTQLEEAEDRSLEEFHKTLATSITPELKMRIMGYTKELKQTHYHMKAMKEIMKAA